MSDLVEKTLEQMTDRELSEKVYKDLELLGGAINATAQLIDRFTQDLVGLKHRALQLELAVGELQNINKGKAIISMERKH